MEAEGSGDEAPWAGKGKLRVSTFFATPLSPHTPTHLSTCRSGELGDGTAVVVDVTD